MSDVFLFSKLFSRGSKSCSYLKKYLHPRCSIVCGSVGRGDFSRRFQHSALYFSVDLLHPRGRRRRPSTLLSSGELGCARDRFKRFSIQYIGMHRHACKSVRERHFFYLYVMAKRHLFHTARILSQFNMQLPALVTQAKLWPLHLRWLPLFL